MKKIISKKRLKGIIQSYMERYDEDPFWGGELQFLQERLQKMESSIAVVGQFSVGKSALLNALLGEKLLATKKLESTKILTRIRHCSQMADAKIVLTFQNQSTQSIPLTNVQDLEKYTTFQGDAAFTDELRFVDLYWPVSFLNEELILIDTPGANSITTSAFQTTTEQLRESSAIIYLFLGTKGLDLQDYELLEEYLKRQKKIFLVGTNRDQVMDEQWDDVKADVIQKLEPYDALKNVEILGVSSLDALEAKQQHNQSLLEQSHILKLEEKIAQYMETREYEQAELQSIQYDFEELKKDIEAEEVIAQQTKDIEEQERLFRLNRLRTITNGQYDDVLRYGEKYLKQRDVLVAELSRPYKESLLVENKKILAKVKKAYSTFKKTVLDMRQSRYGLAQFGLQELKNTYVAHLNNVEETYQTWDVSLVRLAELFQQAINEKVKQEDQAFLALLREVDAQTEIKWDDFDSILKNIQLKEISIAHDVSNFRAYELASDESKQRNEAFTTQLKTLASKKQHEQKQAAAAEQRVKKEAREQQQALGKQPDREAIYETKGVWVFKKEKFVGYDYSAQEQWQSESEKIHQQKNKAMQKINQLKQQNERQINQQIANVEQQKDDLFEAENEATDAFLMTLYKTITEQAEEIQKLHAEHTHEIKAQWQLVVSEQEEQCYEHNGAIFDAFKQFVEDAREQELTNLIVN
ncbi:dynamin family protein [Kurthia huakuii]|uniref:dynamin family protein n=1 Tax=Kurthia huakuii TaxID=1421019 RepID=UPI0004966FA1|nr:dynamin family protein [Kurthia huakuii]MBM7700348.1 GTPase SAR1 family protein [Kurthia huakuii]